MSKRHECDCGQIFDSVIGVMYCQATNHGHMRPDSERHTARPEVGLTRIEAEAVIMALSAQATDEMRYKAWDILNVAMHKEDK